MSVVVNEFEVVPDAHAPPEPQPAPGASESSDDERRLAELLRLRALRVERLRAS